MPPHPTIACEALRIYFGCVLVFGKVRVNRCPCLSEVQPLPLDFIKDLCEYLFSANPKKLEEDFHFYKKRQKAKIAFNVCSLVRCYGSTQASSSQSGPSKLLPQELHSPAQHQTTEL